MKIVDVRLLKGANRWSNYRKNLVEITLDLEEMEEFPTCRVEEFPERLQTLLPSMHSHECSEGVPGGFFERVRQGTWLGHVIEHVALELQTLAGMECGYGRTRSTGKKGEYFVVFNCIYPRAGVYAGKAALELVESLIAKKEYDLRGAIQKLKQIRDEEAFSPLSEKIIEVAAFRKIPTERLSSPRVIILGSGKYQQRIKDELFSSTHSSENLLTESIKAEFNPDTSYYRALMIGGKLALLYCHGDEEDETIYTSRTIHPEQKAAFLPANIIAKLEHTARRLRLPAIAIEFLSQDIFNEREENLSITGVFEKIILPRDYPQSSRLHIAKSLVNFLFPASSPACTPVISVTGSTGISLTARIISQISVSAGFPTGLYGEDGVFINDEKIQGRAERHIEVLRDDTLPELNVVAIHPSEILEAGLPVDECSVSVITNTDISAVEVDGIETNRQLASLYAVVARSTDDHGVIIVNANDDHIYKICRELDASKAFFAYRSNERINQHVANNGMAAVVETGVIILYRNGRRNEVAKLDEISLIDADDKSGIENLLAAILAVAARQISVRAIKKGLKEIGVGVELRVKS